MAGLFVSYSSTDQAFARRLAEDLKSAGHHVWYDEWRVAVGQNVPREIERGVGEARFLVVILSPAAVKSGWVEHEWRMMHRTEIESGRVAVLPVLRIECEIPLSLRDKRRADFRDDARYAAAFHDLVRSIEVLDRPDASLSAPKPSTRTSAPASRGWFTGCLVAVLLLGGLAGAGVIALKAYERQQRADQQVPVEPTGPGERAMMGAFQMRLDRINSGTWRVVSHEVVDRRQEQTNGVGVWRVWVRYQVELLREKTGADPLEAAMNIWVFDLLGRAGERKTTRVLETAWTQSERGWRLEFISNQ